MARPVGGLLILLLLAGAAQAVTTQDAGGDVVARQGGPPVDEPSIDILVVEGTQDNGTLTLTARHNATLPIAAGDGERRHSHLFMVAYGTEPGTSIFQQVAEQDDAIAVVCNFHAGQADLTCQITVGQDRARLVGVQAVERDLTVRLEATEAPYELGASSNISVANATASSGREVIAQDFTPNALPYQGLPGGDGDVPADPPDEDSPLPVAWLLVALLVAARRR